MISYCIHLYYSYKRSKISIPPPPSNIIVGFENFEQKRSLQFIDSTAKKNRLSRLLFGNRLSSNAEKNPPHLGDVLVCEKPV